MRTKILSIIYSFLAVLILTPLFVSAQASTISVTTVQIPDSTTTSVVLKGSVASNNFGARVWFEWGNTTSLGKKTAEKQVNPVPASFESTIVVPVLGAPYYYKACADDDSTPTVCGEVKTVKTGSGKLVVSTTGTEKVTKNGGKLLGGVNFGDSNGGTAWFEWGLSENSLPSKTADQPIKGLGNKFSEELTGLKESTTYYFKACARNAKTKESVCSIIKKLQTISGESIVIGEGDSGFVPNSVELLAPLPGLENINENINISQYLRVLFRVTIGLTIFLAIIFLVLGGIEYATTDAFSGKEAGREKMTNAVLGLLLALSAYVILNTINPKLIDFSFLKPQGVTIDGEDPNFDVTDNGDRISLTAPLPTNACPEKPNAGTCQKLLVKFRGTGGDLVEKTLNTKLNALNTGIPSLKDKWSVTEAYAPAYKHISRCHKNGTCVDLNFNNKDSDATPENVQMILSKAKSLNMCPSYEVLTAEEKKRFADAGVKVSINKNASAPHFHVVGVGCK